MQIYAINNSLKTIHDEKIIHLDRYVEVFKENNISFSKEQYKEAKKELDKYNLID